MIHLDLFAGIGGFSLAAQWMGWETVAQVEWDKWCQKVLAKNFPNALRFGDIVEFNKMLQNGEIITDTFSNGCENRHKKTGRTKRQGEQGGMCKLEGNSTQSTNLGRIDILTGGFPCQPFSHAGKRGGTDDSRYLWPEMLTTIRILKPSFVVGENVAGLVSMENGKTLDGILSDLANEGYTTEQFIIPACGVGAWHRRDRIWIIGYLSERFLQNSDSGGGSRKEGIRENDLRRSKREKQNDNADETGERYGGEILSDSNNQGLQGGEESRNIKGSREKRDEQPERYGESFGGDYWQSEPNVGRVANGIPRRVDRLKGLGNAIVPQVAYEIFKAIVEYEIQPNKR